MWKSLTHARGIARAPGCYRSNHRVSQILKGTRAVTGDTAPRLAQKMNAGKFLKGPLPSH
jgi:plasmid maintenance system antidote protein VapI